MIDEFLTKYDTIILATFGFIAGMAFIKGMIMILKEIWKYKKNNF